MSPGILGAMWRHRLIVIAVMLVAIGAGTAVTMLQPEVYTASARVFMADPRSEGVFSSDPVGDDGRRQQNRVERFRSEPVLTRAAEDVGTSMLLSELRDAVEVVPAAVADEITVTASSTDPLLSRDLANAVVDAYREQFRAEAIADAERTVAVLDQELAVLQQELERIEAELAPLVDLPAVTEEDPDAEEEDAAAADDVAATSQVTMLTLQRSAQATLIRQVLVTRQQTLIEARAAEDIARVEDATTPSAPSRDPLLTISLAAVVGLAAGALLAVWREEQLRARAEAARSARMAAGAAPRRVAPPPQPVRR